MTSSPEVLSAKEQILDCLNTAEIEVVGQFTWGSNFTFLVKLESKDCRLQAVYKPSQGERPLWDFPEETLAGREVAACLLSEALGWAQVPPTVYRQDGPAGPGSLQLRIEHDPEQHYFTFDAATRQRLRPAALFDLLINNADRKGGHVLLGPEGHIWLIDHGLCFHAEPKLRTVIWDFVGEEIPEELLRDIERLKVEDRIYEGLKPYLAESELEALHSRIDAVLESGVFPAPPEDARSTPWPPV